MTDFDSMLSRARSLTEAHDFDAEPSEPVGGWPSALAGCDAGDAGRTRLLATTALPQNFTCPTPDPTPEFSAAVQALRARIAARRKIRDTVPLLDDLVRSAGPSGVEVHIRHDELRDKQAARFTAWVPGVGSGDGWTAEEALRVFLANGGLDYFTATED